MSVGLCWENSAVRTCSFHRLTDSGQGAALYALCVSAPLPPGTHWARCTPQHCGIKWLHLLTLRSMQVSPCSRRNQEVEADPDPWPEHAIWWET